MTTFGANRATSPYYELVHNHETRISYLLADYQKELGGLNEYTDFFGVQLVLNTGRLGLDRVMTETMAEAEVAFTSGPQLHQEHWDRLNSFSSQVGPAHQLVLDRLIVAPQEIRAAMSAAHDANLFVAAQHVVTNDPSHKNLGHKVGEITAKASSPNAKQAMDIVRDAPLWRQFIKQALAVGPTSEAAVNTVSQASSLAVTRTMIDVVRQPMVEGQTISDLDEATRDMEWLKGMDTEKRRRVLSDIVAMKRISRAQGEELSLDEITWRLWHRPDLFPVHL